MILIVSAKEIDVSQPFYASLGRLGGILQTLPVEEKVAALLATEKVDAVIGFSEDLALIKRIIGRFPILNYAVVSSATAKQFHEMTEGYGIFYQLPEEPGADHADEFMALLAKISTPVADRKHAERIR